MRRHGAAAALADMVHVGLPSGASFPVHQQEVAYLTGLAARYMEDLKFTNIVDLQDLDRLLIIELMCFRWGVWLSQGRNYDGEELENARDVAQDLVKQSAEARQLKTQLDVTKKARDKAKGEDSVPVFISNLLARAKEWGVHRENQLDAALELMNELKALVKLHANCDDEERAEMHVEIEDVLEWIVAVMIPEYDRIDEYFRANAQRYWVRTL